MEEEMKGKGKGEGDGGGRGGFWLVVESESGWHRARALFVEGQTCFDWPCQVNSRNGLSVSLSLLLSLVVTHPAAVLFQLFPTLMYVFLTGCVGCRCLPSRPSWGWPATSCWPSPPSDTSWTRGEQICPTWKAVSFFVEGLNFTTVFSDRVPPPWSSSAVLPWWWCTGWVTWRRCCLGWPFRQR